MKKDSFLKQSLIQLDAKAENWQDAIRRAGELLLKNGFVEEQYIQAMIDVVNEYGPYIVIAKGVAVAHAKPSNGVLSTGLSFVRLEKGVDFNAKDYDPVKIILGVSAFSHEDHIEMLSKLANILDCETTLDALLTAKDVEEIINIF